MLPEFTDFYKKKCFKLIQHKYQTELDNLLLRQSQSCISSVPQIDVASLAALISRLKPKKAA